MAKKLNKKIEELCGLSGLDWEARQKRANEILTSPEWKQRLCNELIGLSFRELERTLSKVASERQKKEEGCEHKSDINRPKSAHKNNNRPRTLAQILAQVYAPRVVQEFTKSQRICLSDGADGSSVEIQQNTTDEDNTST